MLDRVPGSFAVEWPDGSTQDYGPNTPTFRLRLSSEEVYPTYLWGITHSFQTNDLQAYHVLGTRAPSPQGTVPIFGELVSQVTAVASRPHQPAREPAGTF